MLMHHLLYRAAERAPGAPALNWVDRDVALTAEQAVTAWSGWPAPWLTSASRPVIAS